jgi:hypothetical protein
LQQIQSPIVAILDALNSENVFRANLDAIGFALAALQVDDRPKYSGILFATVCRFLFHDACASFNSGTSVA